YGIIDIEEALLTKPNSIIKTSISEIIQQGEEALDNLNSFVGQLDASVGDTFLLDENELEWEPVITPNKIICVGLNYKKHADETGLPYPKVPILFNKFNNALAGHNEDILLP